MCRPPSAPAFRLLRCHHCSVVWSTTARPSSLGPCLPGTPGPAGRQRARRPARCMQLIHARLPTVQRAPHSTHRPTRQGPDVRIHGQVPRLRTKYGVVGGASGRQRSRYGTPPRAEGYTKRGLWGQDPMPGSRWRFGMAGCGAWPTLPPPPAGSMRSSGLFKSRACCAQACSGAPFSPRCTQNRYMAGTGGQHSQI